MEQYINKSAVKAEIERRKQHLFDNIICERDKEWAVRTAHQLNRIISFLDTLEVKEVNIAEMADDYYDALMEEAAAWMDEGTMGHCRLAYYNGCKDVLAKLQKEE
jgi:hypothetical protein